MRKAFLVVCLAAASCKTYTLEMRPVASPVRTNSAASSLLGEKSLKRVTVVPASGEAGSAFDPARSKIHLALMSRGIEVVDPAVSARVSRQDGRPSTTEATDRHHTTDLEALIIMAEKNNIDAVLRFDPPTIEAIPPTMGAESMPPDRGNARYFLARSGSRLDEVSRSEYALGIADGRVGRWFTAGVLTFKGDVLDIPTGTVLALFDIEIPLVGLCSPYHLKFKKCGEIVSRSYDWGSEGNAVLLEEEAMKAFYDHFVDVIKSRQAIPPLE